MKLLKLAGRSDLAAEGLDRLSAQPSVRKCMNQPYKDLELLMHSLQKKKKQPKTSSSVAKSAEVLEEVQFQKPPLQDFDKQLSAKRAERLPFSPGWND